MIPLTAWWAISLPAPKAIPVARVLPMEAKNPPLRGWAWIGETAGWTGAGAALGGGAWVAVDLGEDDLPENDDPEINN